MREIVTNDRFLEVYGPINATLEELNPEQRKNRKVINKAASSYIISMPEENLQRCIIDGVWRCLGYHKEGKGLKLTTNLWKFVKRECNREMRKLKPKSNKPHTFSLDATDNNKDLLLPQISKEIEILKDSIEALSGINKQLITQYYLENRTMEEIGRIHNFSKETARQKIKKALQCLREIYMDKN